MSSSTCSTTTKAHRWNASVQKWFLLWPRCDYHQRLDRHTICEVTTVGRISGRRHRFEIWFAHYDGTVYMLSGGGDRSDWVRNLIANPAVTVDVAGVSLSGSGRVVEAGTDEDRLARDLVFAKYTPTYIGDLTDWRNTALPVAIDLGG